MIPVSAAFTAAETSDIAQVAGKVFILRGNYANANSWGATASASDTDSSGNYPAAGAIQGDHTEINIGAPSVADNGVGLISWKGANTPSGGSPSTLTITFGAQAPGSGSPTFNYIKLYNLSTNPLTAYTLQYYNGSTWVTFATYAASYRTNGGLDIYDFSGAGTTFTGSAVRCVVTGSTSGPANIVALEVYYKYDVTSRCTSVKTNRQRDWKQINPMAALVNIEFDNSDQFFSPSYTPTAAQVTAGYFNSELDAGLTVIAQIGFWYQATPYWYLGYGEGGFGGGPYGGGVSGAISNPEIYNSFVGTIDDIKVSSKAGTCTMQARDGMKDVINQTWSTRLKYNIDTGACIQYCLNICNISNYEMNVDTTTGIIQPYFFLYETSMLTGIQSLVQACGAAQFWFDENGVAQFQQLLNTPSSQTDFMFNSFSPLNFVEIAGVSPDTVTVVGNSIVIYSADGNNGCSAAAPMTTMTAWQFTANFNPAGGGVHVGWVTFAAQSQGTSSTSPDGYSLYFYKGESYDVRLVKQVSGSTTVLASASVGFSLANTPTTWTVARSSAGDWFVWCNGTLVISSVNDTSYTTSSYFYAFAFGTGSFPATLTVSNINTLNTSYTITLSGSNLYFVSEIIDQGTALSSEGNLSAGFAPSNAPITYQTRTATTSGGISGASWTSVTINTSTQQGPITSTALRYIQYQFYFAVGSSVPLWPTYYVGISWNLSGAVAYRQFSYAVQVCDITQEISDSLSGDSSIVNYFEVLSSPLLLTGSTSTVQWNATAGFPIDNVSASNPLVVNTGIITIQAVISGGMDITYMGTSITGTAGNSYGAAGTTAFLVTFGTAAGTVSISYIHPTKPIITLNITTAGTITQLQIIGQGFSSSSNPIDVIAGDPASQSRYKRRTTQINNNFIQSPGIAQLIANTQLLLYKTPATLLTGLQLLLTPSVQLTDQFQITDYLLGLSSQVWNITGVQHEITKDKTGEGATVQTALTAIIIP